MRWDGAEDVDLVIVLTLDHDVGRIEPDRSVIGSNMRGAAE
jgi:hypothetical protein